ncbi:MAG: S41 family peptidase [Candidatus Promineifilaceae bacterium]
MQVKKLYIILGVIFVAVMFMGGYAFGQSQYAPIDMTGTMDAASKDTEDAFNPFWEALELIHEEFYEQPLDDDELAKGAIDGMLATLEDPNTRYLAPEQEQAAREAMEGNLEGIGAEVSSVDGAIVIVAPYEGSPAESAGIRAGDILREADGTPLTGLDPSEAASLVRGPAGTPVLLVVERDGELFDVEVIRGVIKIPSVRGEIFEDGIAYVRLSRFANDTNQELADIIEELLIDDPQGIILDLRGNPGGNLTAAVDVADHFLDQGTILVEKFGNGEEIEFESDVKGNAQELPLVVLINQGSASASEVVAGAIQDRDRGVLIGDTSFGKGTVQVWKSLSNDGGIRITIARWLTPDGEWVHEEGLEPDYIVLLPEAEEEEFSDTQLQAAIDFILGRPVLETAPGDG